MLNANLELIREMRKRKMDYPLHLGVTEAGEGEDGRIRSAAGIGPLLAMGIGDTIRVSLTEDPVSEIPVAKKLRNAYPRNFAKTWNKPEKTPSISILMQYACNDHETLALKASSEISLMIHLGYGSEYLVKDASGKKYPELLDSILQATGVKITGTEYISCPTCGRTTFDIQHVLRKVKENTRGLKGVKIAVMGCIVNGPGEMAGADYGYVGASAGKVNLYHKGQVIRKNIPEKEALEALLKLIKETMPVQQ
jgi:(E)-4-hydroxy-3-methylbut-2-enyl-diphosphate synthase